MQMAVIRPSKEELARTLRLHRAWLDGDDEGATPTSATPTSARPTSARPDLKGARDMSPLALAQTEIVPSPRGASSDGRRAATACW
jgi:hypothetical protein